MGGFPEPFVMLDAPRLFLISPPVADAARFAPLLEAALAAADVACVLVRTAARDEGGAKAILRALAPLIQGHGAALLVENDPRLPARVDADGVHMADADSASMGEALAALKPDRIVGAGAFATRDDAMQAGEAGVDYVMFGGPDDDSEPALVHERAAWWAEIFNVPCVAYAHHPDAAEMLARTGAEFIALGDSLWDEPAKVDATVRAVAAAIRVPAEEIAR